MDTQATCIMCGICGVCCQIREHGTTVQTADILKFTQLFKDDITLDNMSRDHLLALAKLLELNTIGTNKMIAFQLRMKLRQLKADDKVIIIAVSSELYFLSNY